MAELCLKCFNEYVHTEKSLTENDVILQWDICEKCGHNAPCVVQVKTPEQIAFERVRELDE